MAIMLIVNTTNNINNDKKGRKENNCNKGNITTILIVVHEVLVTNITIGSHVDYCNMELTASSSCCSWSSPLTRC